MRRCNERIKLYQSKYDEISDITGIAKEKRRMSVTKSEKVLTNGIKRGNINTTHEHFRAKSSPSNRIPLSRKRFDELVIEARKNGANIIRCEYGDEIFKHLEENNATASCIGDTLIFRPDATLTEVLEETHHFNQNLQGLNDDKPVKLRKILNEIEANEFIIKNSKKYGLPRVELEECERQLKKYQIELKKYYKEE